MNKAIYILLHLTVLFFVTPAPVCMYGFMYMHEHFNLLFIGGLIPFVYVGCWVMCIKKLRPRIIVLNILTILFIMFVYTVAAPLLPGILSRSQIGNLLPVLLIIHLLVIISLMITHYLNKNKYLGKTYLFGFFISLILAVIVTGLWLLELSMHGMLGAIRG